MNISTISFEEPQYLHALKFARKKTEIDGS